MSQANRNEIVAVELINTKGRDTKFVVSMADIEYLYLIEDVMSICITGKLKFMDRIGMKEFAPLTGDEKVKITVGYADNVPDKKKYREITMYVFKIDKLVPGSGSQKKTGDVVEYTLVDEYFFKFHQQYIDKTWKDKYIHEIVSDICKDFVGISPGDFEVFSTTREKLPFFSTNKRTPSECIIWLMNRASDSSRGDPCFLLYRATSRSDETKYKFYFRPMDQLFTGPYMEPKGEDYVYTMWNTNSYQYVNDIMEFSIKPSVEKRELKSLLGGTVLGYDIMKKKLIEKKYTHTDGLSKVTCLGRYSIIPTDLLSYVPEKIVVNDGHFDEKILDNIWYSRWIKNYNLHSVMRATVRGHQQRYAGGLIRIEWKSSDPNEVFNKQYDGKYAVKSITNYFAPSRDSEGWQQCMLLMKNGYKDSENTQLVPASRRNV